MPITPLDIRKKSFAHVTFKGLDEKEVKSFLEQVARDMEAIWKERSLLAEKVEELNARLEGFTRTEKAFQEAFLHAQKTCETMKENAHSEAATLLAQAKMDGEKMVRQAEEQVNLLAQDINEIKTKRMAMLGEMKGIIESFDKMVEHWESQEKKKA